MATDILDWAKAEQHLRGVMKQYGELAGTPGVNVMPALTMVLQPLLKRFVEGERTAELHAEMMAVE